MRFLFIYLMLLLMCPQVGGAQSPESQQAQSRPTSSTKQDEPRVPVDLPSQQQVQMGLQVAKVEKKDLEPLIRTVGTVSTDQRQEVHVHARVSGWIEELLVDYVGKQVQKGQALFRLYSPDLVSTQNEYLSALRFGGAGREIAASALKRLRFLGVPESEIQVIRKSGQVKRLITFSSPIDGYVVNKMAIQGQYVTPDLELYYLADLSKVWLLVTLYEFDLSVVKVGDRVKATFPYNQNKVLQGKISYIYPEIDPQTRTGKARIEIEAASNDELKPGMYANVEIQKKLGPTLVIPEDSVIDTGFRKIVFVKTGPTRFEPREVKLGPRVEHQFIVQSGLQEGEEVVSSANFLLDTESKLQAVIQKGTPAPAGHGGHGK